MTRVEVTWLDATSVGSGWQSPEDAIRLAELLVVRSIGWLVSRSRSQIIIAQSRQIQTGALADTITIPNGIIRKVRILR